MSSRIRKIMDILSTLTDPEIDQVTAAVKLERDSRRSSDQDEPGFSGGRCDNCGCDPGIEDCDESGCCHL